MFKLYLSVFDYYCQCLMLTVCTKGLRVTQFQFSVCMYCTCGRIDNKADLTWLDLTWLDLNILICVPKIKKSFGTTWEFSFLGEQSALIMWRWTLLNWLGKMTQKCIPWNILWSPAPFIASKLSLWRANPSKWLGHQDEHFRMEHSVWYEGHESRVGFGYSNERMDIQQLIDDGEFWEISDCSMLQLTNQNQVFQRAVQCKH